MDHQVNPDHRVPSVLESFNDQLDDQQWWVYLIRTRYDTLYCGITNNLQRRFTQHQQGKGAKALKGKGPLKLVWWQPVASKSVALKQELAIKKLTKAKKEMLVNEFIAYPIEMLAPTTLS